MIRSLFRRRTVLIGILALLAAGPAFALLQFTPGTTLPVAGPVSIPQTYNIPVTISPGTYGDQILGIEVGRDAKSPFAAITVTMYTPLAGFPTNPAVVALQPFFPNIPGFPVVAPYPFPQPSPGSTFRFIYRPIDDLVNPGWGPAAGAPGQLAIETQACVAVASEFAAFRTAAQFVTGGPRPLAFAGAGTPQLYIELNPLAGPNNLEFYIFHIIR